MNPALEVDAAVHLAKFIHSTVNLYQQGALSHKQLSNIWHEAGVNVSKANKLWKQASPSGGGSNGS